MFLVYKEANQINDKKELEKYLYMSPKKGCRGSMGNQINVISGLAHKMWKKNFKIETFKKIFS